MKNYILQKQFTITIELVFIGIILLLSFSTPCFGQNKKTTESYKTLIKQANQAFEAKDYEVAMLLYGKASQANPEYNYAADKIVEIKTILDAGKDSKTQSSTQSNKSGSNYKTLVAQADYALNSKEYAAALLFYQKAYETRPDYNYAPEKIDEINSTLNASPESKAQLYENTIQKAENYYVQKDYQKANSEFQKAALIDSSARLPKERLVQISSNYIDPADMANFNLAISSGDKKVALFDFDHAILFYQAALELHPNSKFVIKKIGDTKMRQAQYLAQGQTGSTIASADKQRQSEKPAEVFSDNQKISESAIKPDAQNVKEISTVAVINENKYKVLPANTDKTNDQAVQQKYDAALASADNLLKSAEYEGALTGFKSASAIKPGETYPKQRIDEINKIIEETAKTRSSEYNKALEIADKLYKTKVFDQAIEAYEAAAKLNPVDTYPDLQIGKIRKYLSDHAIIDLFSQALVISTGNEKKFTFTALDPSLRKNNYILLKARSTGKTEPKVYLDYGKDNQKNGGIVLRNLDKSTLKDFLISISIQDKWFREENNWIKIVVETGEIEITKVQIAAGE